MIQFILMVYLIFSMWHSLYELYGSFLALYLVPNPYVNVK